MRFMKNVAMTACQDVQTTRVFTPIGDMGIVSCSLGLHSIFQMAPDDKDFSPDKSIRVDTDRQDANLPTLACLAWLTRYFQNHASGQEVIDMPPICQTVTNKETFTVRVWLILQTMVPFGQTTTYGSLAKLCGSEKASRAVGQAMRNNPLQLLVPCHRVIQASGQIGNYASGQKNKVKEWLLKHEGAI